MEQSVLEEKLNGKTIGQALDVFDNSYTLIKDEKDKFVDPNTERTRIVNDLAEKLNTEVKDILGKDVRASREQARNIADKISYELAQANLYKGKPEELPETRRAEYIANAFRDLGIPISTIEQFVTSVQDMVATKPGDPHYDSNSPLAQLIRYIATKKDEKSDELRYTNQLVQAAWEHPDKGLKLITGLNEKFNLNLGSGAKASDALQSMQSYANLQTQTYLAKLEKSFNKPGADVTKTLAEIGKDYASKARN